MIHALNLLSERLDTPGLEEDEILSLKDALKTLENVIKLRAITSELPARRLEIETLSKANLALEGPIRPEISLTDTLIGKSEEYD